MFFNPPSSAKIEAGDKLVALGEVKDLKKFEDAVIPKHEIEKEKLGGGPDG